MVPAKFELRRNASAWEGGKPEGDLSSHGCDNEKRIGSCRELVD
jgi:hypothetical protein